MDSEIRRHSDRHKIYPSETLDVDKSTSEPGECRQGSPVVSKINIPTKFSLNSTINLNDKRTLSEAGEQKSSKPKI
jgi:hypothetical protein